MSEYPPLHDLASALPHVCPVCRQRFRLARERDGHLLREHTSAEEPKRYQCGECDKSFRTAVALVAHSRKAHSPEAKQRAAIKGAEAARAVPADLARRLAHQLVTTRGRLSDRMADFSARHDHACYWCGKPVLVDATPTHPWAPTREHLVPRSRGGSDRSDNVKLAHRICNQRRAYIDAEAFRRLMRGEAVTAAEMWPDDEAEPFNGMRVAP